MYLSRTSAALLLAPHLLSSKPSKNLTHCTSMIMNTRSSKRISKSNLVNAAPGGTTNSRGNALTASGSTIVDDNKRSLSLLTGLVGI